MLLVVLFVASRYIYGKTVNRLNQCIYWVSSIFIMLSMSAMIIILSVMNGFESELKKNLLYLIPHVVVTSTQGYINSKNIPDFLSLPAIKNNITYIKPLIFSDIILQSSKSISLGMMFGVDPNYFEPLFDYLIHHNVSQLISGKYYIIIGSALAQKLSVNIHDQIRLTVPSIHYNTPIGCFPIQRLFTILDIYHSSNDEIDSCQVLVHKNDAAVLLNYPPQHITGWRIWIDEPFKVSKLEQWQCPKDWIWTDWRKYKGSLFQAIKMEKNVMFFLFILMIVTVSGNIIAFLVLLITEKHKEIAILQTYGFNRLQIVILLIIQGVSSGVLGIICGVGLGVCLAKKLNQILFLLNIFSENLYFPIEIPFIQIFNISLMICGFIVLIILYPAWYISSIYPAQVLRHGQ